MNTNDFRPFSYDKQEWENNPQWLFDAYRRVALDQDKGLSDPKGLERFIKNIAKLDDLTDPQRIALFNGPSGKLMCHNFEAEEIVQPFEKLIEAVTDEVLELVKIFGREYVGMKTAEANAELNQGIKGLIAKHRVDIGIPDYVLDRSGGGEEWAIKQLREELRNNVAAMIFKSIRGFAVAEHLHREQRISDGQYRQMVETIATALDKTGINGLGKFLKANPGIEEILETDERKFVPEQYKIRYKEDGKETGELSEWWPNDREKRSITRGEFYQWHLEELEKKQANPPAFGNWNYDQALLTAQHQTIGPEYCAAVKKRNKVMGSFELGEGGQSTTQEKFNYAINLGYDLSNEELQRLMQEGTKDLSSEKARTIYLVNNLLGSLDPRTLEVARKAQNDAISDPSSDFLPSPPREPEKDPSRLLTAGDEPESQKKSPSRGERDAASGQSSTNYGEKSERRDSSKEKAPDQRTSNEDDKSKHDGYVTAGKIGSTAVLGTVIGASLLSMTKKPDNGTSDESSKKSQSNKRFIATIAALAAAAGIVVVWKYPDVVFDWLKKGGRSV